MPESLDAAKIKLYQELLMQKPSDLTDDEVEIAYRLARDPCIQARLKAMDREETTVEERCGAGECSLPSEVTCFG